MLFTSLVYETLKACTHDAYVRTDVRVGRVVCEPVFSFAWF